MKYSITQKGFTLVEVLVAVTVLLLVVTGPMAIMTRTTQSTTFATEQATAFFLAQEGLELVQKIRDDEVLEAFRAQYPSGGSDIDAMVDFETVFANCIAANVCGVTIDNAANAGVTITAPCAGTNITNCLLRTRTGVSGVRPVYVHGATGTTTPYTRTINITRIPTTGNPVREYQVTSVVTWRSGTLLSDQQVRLVTYIENTYDND